MQRAHRRLQDRWLLGMTRCWIKEKSIKGSLSNENARVGPSNTAAFMPCAPSRWADRLTGPEHGARRDLDAGAAQGNVPQRPLVCTNAAGCQILGLVVEMGRRLLSRRRRADWRIAGDGMVKAPLGRMRPGSTSWRRGGGGGGEELEDSRVAI